MLDSHEGVADIEQAEKLTKDSEYTVSPYRFVIAFLYTFSTIMTGIVITGFSPIETDLAKIYDLSLLEVTVSTSLLSPILYPLSNIIANYFLDDVGLKAGILCANILLASGLWLRTLCSNGFIFLLFGQILACFATPFILNAP